MPKKTLSIVSLIFILLVLLGIFSNINRKNDYLNGTEIIANVIEKPYNCEFINSRSTYIKIQYKNLIISKKIGYGYCDELEKKTIKVILSPDQKDMFLINELEFMKDNIVAWFLIIGVLILCFVKSRKKNQ